MNIPLGGCLSILIDLLACPVVELIRPIGKGGSCRLLTRLASHTPGFSFVRVFLHLDLHAKGCQWVPIEIMGAVEDVP